MSVPSSRSIILSVFSLAVLFMVTVSSFSTAPLLPTEKERAADKRQAAKDRGWKRPAAHHEEPQEWHTLNASYYDTRGRWSSKLTLNNKGRDAAQPVVTLFNPQGRPYVVPNVVVPGRVGRKAGSPDSASTRTNSVSSRSMATVEAGCAGATQPAECPWSLTVRMAHFWPESSSKTREAATPPAWPWTPLPAPRHPHITAADCGA